MEPIRKPVDTEPEPDDNRQVLQNIAEDARALKDRYLEDTIVPEGGE